jgi:phage baseplate assembly protein W
MRIFLANMRINPVSNDVRLLIDRASIKESLSNLLTDRGERLFQPRWGLTFGQHLFENNTPAALEF